MKPSELRGMSIDELRGELAEQERGYYNLRFRKSVGEDIHATEMMSIYTYKLAFSRFEFSLASASAVIIFILSMSMTYFYIKHQKAAR